MSTQTFNLAVQNESLWTELSEFKKAFSLSHTSNLSWPEHTSFSPLVTRTNPFFFPSPSLSVEPDPESFPWPIHVCEYHYQPPSLEQPLSAPHADTHRQTHIYTQVAAKNMHKWASGEGRKTSNLLIWLTAAQQRGLVLLHRVIRLSLSRLLLHLCLRMSSCSKAGDQLIALVTFSPKESRYSRANLQRTIPVPINPIALKFAAI